MMSNTAETERTPQGVRGVGLGSDVTEGASWLGGRWCWLLEGMGAVLGLHVARTWRRTRDA